MNFAEYIEAGWRLVPIPSGRKGPIDKYWNAANLPQRPIPVGYNVGLMHVESKTCAIDIDNLPIATAWLESHRISLSSMLTASDAVRISSGRSGRAKLLYRLSSPLASVKTAPFRQLSEKSGKEETYTALDFRCATKEGLSLQDVLPPSIHPETHQPYTWEYGDELTGSWRNLPELPPELRAVWESQLTAKVDTGPAAPSGASFDEIRSLIAQQDPNAAYNEWLRVGMAIHHETNGSRDGLLLWNEWSAQASGRDKYKGLSDLEPHWRSFSSTAAGAVTLGSLRAEVVAEVGDFPVVPVSTTTPPRKFKPHTFDEFIDGPPPEWLVDGVMPKATIGVIYGAPGSGKSFLIVDIAFHIAEGREWRGLETKCVKVAYLIAEGVSGGRQRLRAARKEFGFDTANFVIIDDTPNLLDKADPPALARELQGVGLVIVDTLAQTIPGGDENSAKDMSVALEHCKLIHKATGAMVMLVAHSGKDEDRGMRGWSGVLGALDVELKVTEGPDGLRVAKVTKMKDGEEGAQYAFRLRRVEDGSRQGTCVVEHTEEKPKAKVIKHKAGSAEALIRQTYPTLAPMGTGLGVPVDDLVHAVVAQIPYVTGSGTDKRVSAVTHSLMRMTADPANSLFVKDGMVYPRETDPTNFALRPIEGNAGIDAEPTPVQDNSDLLGV